jgi:hypothetical protein
MSEYFPFPEFEEKVQTAVSTPEARPEFVSQLRRDLLQREMKTRPRFALKPAWGLLIGLLAVALIVAAPQAVKALKQLFGYVPGVGLVESYEGMRVLDEPVSLTRDGVTLTIEYVFVYEDHVELIYDVQGIDPSNDGALAEDGSSSPTAFCGGVNIGELGNHDGDALLRLPDGTTLERDRTGLYPQNAFAMKPVYKVSIPGDVMEMTLLLDCIPWARLGAVPENWELPFELARVPEGENVGLPVIDVESAEPEPALMEQTVSEEPEIEEPTGAEPPLTQPAEAEPVLPSPDFVMTLEKVAQTESSMLFYISLEMKDADPSLVSIMPEDMYLIDALGQKIPLYASGPWQPFLHRPGSLFEYFSLEKPADGPLTIVMDDAVVYYAPLYVDPPQATPAEMTLRFDVGANPQHGQSWALDSHFEIAGYPFQVVSARAVAWEDVEEPSYIVGSQGYDYGYQFMVQGDPRVKMSVMLDLVSEKCGLWVRTPADPEGSDLVYTSLCREAYPTGEVAAIVHELSVLVEGQWQTSWGPAGN